MNTGFEDAGSIYGGVILSNDPLMTSDVLLTQTQNVESAREQSVFFCCLDFLSLVLLSCLQYHTA